MESSFCQEPTPHSLAVRPTNRQSGLDPLFAPLLLSLRLIFLQRNLIYRPPFLSHTPRLHCELALGERQRHTSLPAPHQILFRTRSRLLHSEVRSRLRGCVRKRAAWKQNAGRRSTMRYADAISSASTAQGGSGTYSSLSTRVPIVPALVASPLPGPVHSITRQPHNSVLDDTRGQGRKREVQDDEVVRNPVMNVIPLRDEVVSATLKRPSLVTDIQPRLPRFSSLPDMGHMWYAERTETEEPDKEKCAAAKDGGDMKQ
ncbi:hypothetical protein EDB89DRAFT_666476 [Lactarius sanguifluus]|nr:hypothetical protein EDB89DRAFT_666476 [Lactarius sanguifluus]